MLNGLVAGLADDRDDVEAYGVIETMIVYVGIGCLYEISDLAIRDGLYGVAMSVAHTRFYLNDGDCPILLRDDVHLFVAQSPVALPYGIASCHEVSHRTVFADLTKFIVLCHAYIYKGIARIVFLEDKLRQKIPKYPLERLKKDKISDFFERLARF